MAEGYRISDLQNSGRLHGQLLIEIADLSEPSVSLRSGKRTWDELREYVLSGIPSPPEGVVWVTQPEVEVENGNMIRSMYPGQANWNGVLVNYSEGTIDTVNLPAAGLERFDAVVATEQGQLQVVTGVESQNPVTPYVGPGKLFVGYVKFTSAGGNVPDQVTPDAFNIGVLPDLPGTIQDTDMFAVFRNGTHYKVSGAKIKTFVGSTAEPEEPADTTAPVISNVSVSEVTQNAATFNAQLNEAGTIYWAAYPSATTARPKSEILAGTGARSKGSIETFGNGPAWAGVTNLVASTAYRVQYFAADEAGNETNAALSSAFTTAAPDQIPAGASVLNATGTNQTTSGLTLNWTNPA